MSAGLRRLQRGGSQRGCCACWACGSRQPRTGETSDAVELAELTRRPRAILLREMGVEVEDWGMSMEGSGREEGKPADEVFSLASEVPAHVAGGGSLPRWDRGTWTGTRN